MRRSPREQGHATNKLDLGHCRRITCSGTYQATFPADQVQRMMHQLDEVHVCVPLLNCLRHDHEDRGSENEPPPRMLIRQADIAKG